MKRRFFLPLAIALAVVLNTAPAMAKIEHLLPKPHLVEQGSGFLSLTGAITINDARSTSALTRFVQEFGGTPSFGSSNAQITVEYVGSLVGTDDHSLPGYANEAYRIEVTSTGILIKAIDQIGVIRAAQTLTQMAQGWGSVSEIRLEQATITDWAAFKVRGYMHDVGRSFISIETLKKHIRLLSRFKINTFHWHMTENQAWRFEVKDARYSMLTEAQYMAPSRFPGQYYTQEQCTEVEAYAREYGVTVIPEIDMPGHSAAFVSALGYSMQSEQGTAALKVILREVVQAFPLAPYIHIGADEEDIHQLSWLQGMVNFVRNDLGRKCALWNPIKNQNVVNTDAELTHMWGTAGRAIAGKANIDSRYNYTNHFDTYADIVGIYKSNIYYEQKGTPTVAGTISAAWNDRVTPTENDIVRENGFYAHVIASCVRAWMGGGKQYIDNMTNGGTNGFGGTTLPNSGEEFEDFKDFETRFLFHKAHSLAEDAALIPYVKQTNVRWFISDAFPNGGNANTVFPPEQMKSQELLPTSFTHNGQEYGVRIATGAGIYLRHTWGQSIIKSFYDAPAYNQTAYAWTYVYAPQAMTVGAQIEFYNYSRSEKDPVPTSGWDFYGSRIWINDTEVSAPTYTNGGQTITNEVQLRNENFASRPTPQFQLNEGWNKVFIKLPYHNAAYRLDKWMFTFVFTDPAGHNAAEGLVYSPLKSLDDNATLLQGTLLEAKQVRNQYVRDEVGYYPVSLATHLDALIAQIEGTLQAEMPLEQRQAQQQSLSSAIAQFRSALSTATVVQPQEGIWYVLSTPNRGTRYATSQGEGQPAVGATAVSGTSEWKFISRGDGSWNIVNSDGSYLSPNSAYNTALITTSTVPAQGWTLSASDLLGGVIITSGSVQINQTSNVHNWRLFNWGNGTNKSDAGGIYHVRKSNLVVHEHDLFRVRTQGGRYFRNTVISATEPGGAGYADRLAQTTSTADAAIFMRVGTKLIEVETGKALGLKNNRHTLLNYTDAGEAVSITPKMGDPSQVTIVVNGRFLYAANNVLHADAGGFSNGIPNSDFYYFTLEPVSTLPLTASITVGSRQVGTFYTPVSGRLDGATAYTAAINAEGKTVELTPISGGLIPAGTAFVFEGNGNFTIEEHSASLTDNALRGTKLAGAAVEANDFYLSYQHQAFIPFSTTAKYRAFRAYLPTNGEFLGTGNTAQLMFDFGDITAIPAFNISATAPLFDLSGRRVTQPYKRGVYLQNGQKIVH